MKNTTRLRRRLDAIAPVLPPPPVGAGSVLATLEDLAKAPPVPIAERSAGARRLFDLSRGPDRDLLGALTRIAGQPLPDDFATADTYAAAVERWHVQQEGADA